MRRALSLILLAGGVGSRMRSATPKQYLPLRGKTIACHSLDIFSKHPDIEQRIVVCASEFRHHFEGYDVEFADPGPRRQDSLQNGLKKARAPWILTHDAARPLLSLQVLEALLATEAEAATLALPAKNTLKRSCRSQHVIETVDRSEIWEVQTPQLIKRSVLDRGFLAAGEETVTDDVSFAELVGCPVQIISGSPCNIKITTPEDLHIAEALYAKI